MLIDGLQVDLWHISLEREARIIHSVLEDYDTDLGSLNALDTLRTCIPLYGHEMVEKWVEQAQAYPDGLAQKIIQEQIATFSLAELSLADARDNPTAFYAHMSQLHQGIFMVLLALNRSYFPTYKWLYRRLGEITIKPVEIEGRLRRSFVVPYPEAIEEMKKLLEETLGLVEHHFQSLDTRVVHQRLGYMRKAYPKPVE